MTQHSLLSRRYTLLRLVFHQLDHASFLAHRQFTLRLTAAALGRAVSGYTRGFGPSLRGVKGRSSRRSSIALHSGLPSGQPTAGTRSIRVVVAASAGIARRAAKSEISARNGA